MVATPASASELLINEEPKHDSTVVAFNEYTLLPPTITWSTTAKKDLTQIPCTASSQTLCRCKYYCIYARGLQRNNELTQIPSTLSWQTHCGCRYYLMTRFAPKHRRHSCPQCTGTPPFSPLSSTASAMKGWSLHIHHPVSSRSKRALLLSVVGNMYGC